MDERTLKYLLESYSELEVGLVVGGAPCQPFSGLNRDHMAFEDSRSAGIDAFVQIVAMLRRIAPHIAWHTMLENVASMSPTNRELISEELGREHPQPTPYWVDAALVGQVSRPRLYWVGWEPEDELQYKDSGHG